MDKLLLLEHLAARRAHDAGVAFQPSGPLIVGADVAEFLTTASGAFTDDETGDILRRAVTYTLPSGTRNLELAFISLYAALESILTFFRRQDEYEILGAEEFAALERELRGWLKQHALLRDESAKRGLIYEKIRELNRFPFSYVFRRFCEQHALDLSDLWPVLGRPEQWPLMEIRHRLVHGDPFRSRPAEALACASQHLHWVVERMLLSVLGWPVSRSGVSPEQLLRDGGSRYTAWQAERARFS